MKKQKTDHTISAPSTRKFFNDNYPLFEYSSAENLVGTARSVNSVRKVRKLTQQIDKLKVDLAKIHTDIEEKKNTVDKKARPGRFTPAEFTDFKQKCHKKIIEMERKIRRKELARQAVLKKIEAKKNEKEE